MNYANYAVVIVGSGIAGLYAALKINQNKNTPGKILLVTKSKLGESNSRYAQGGIVGVLKENTLDSTASHISDTIRAGAGLSDFNTVKFVSENSDKVIKDLLSMGVDFDRDENNQFTFTLEAAHSVNRVLHSGGDATGRMIERHLTKCVSDNPDIDICEQTIVVELLTGSNGECNGLIMFNDLNGEYTTVTSPVVILASGGTGQLYKNTTNPAIATGDGIALAYSVGAVIQDMEFIQFHPTALAVKSKDANFLISEAVRGEGAKLVNSSGFEFMQKYHEKKELAPRDIVTRAIFNEMQENNTDNVFLNATSIPAETLHKRFPNISKICNENGIDITKDLIPVHPAAHYCMGGIKTNLYGKTSISGLYAIGEVSSTGLHGANRLASNSLLECVVCAYGLADYLKNNSEAYIFDIDSTTVNDIDKYSLELGFIEYDVDALKSELQEIMWENVGILRSETTLKQAKEQLMALNAKFVRSAKCLNRDEYEFKNMLLVAKLIINSALNRKESRGAHYRTDFLATKETVEHNCIMKEQGEPIFVR